MYNQQEQLLVDILHNQKLDVALRDVKLRRGAKVWFSQEAFSIVYSYGNFVGLYTAYELASMIHFLLDGFAEFGYEDKELAPNVGNGWEKSDLGIYELKKITHSYTSYLNIVPKARFEKSNIFKRGKDRITLSKTLLQYGGKQREI